MKKVAILILTVLIVLVSVGCKTIVVEYSSAETSTVYDQSVTSVHDEQDSDTNGLNNSQQSSVDEPKDENQQTNTNSSNTTSIWWPEHMQDQTNDNITIENNSSNDKYEKNIIVDGKKYSYVWGDEFTNDSIDYGDALYSNGPIKEGKIWDTTGMVPWFDDISIPAKPADRKKYNYIKDGALTMKAGCFDWSNQGNQTFNFKPINDKLKYAMGGVITTRKTMVYRKGYAEIRAKVPLLNGAWPAWWLRSTGSDLIKYPDGGTDKTPIYTLEIDVFEAWAYLGTAVYPGIHKWYKNTYNPKTDTVLDYEGNDITSKITGQKNLESSQFSCVVPNRKPYNFDLDNFDDYHTYGFLWTDDKMAFSVDGEVYFTVDLTTAYDGYSDGRYDFNQYMYFLFDCHLMTPGASWGGTNAQRYTGNGDTSDVEFNVEYIRLWQEEGKEDIILK